MEGRNIPDPSFATAYESSDQLFNVCCYAFLCNVADAISPTLLKSLQAQGFSTLAIIHQKANLPYDGTFAYGDLYRGFIMSLEKELKDRHLRRESDHISQHEGVEGLSMSDMQNTEDSAEDLRSCHMVDDVFDDVVKAVMVNDNLSLERAVAMIDLVNIPESYDSYSDFKHAIKKRMQDGKQTVNTMTPASREKGRLGEALGGGFHEMGLTGIPCIKHYSYLKSLQDWPVELRVGTQFVRTGQFDGYVSYIYQRWLQVKLLEHLNAVELKAQSDITLDSGDKRTPITHIYFHNMAKDEAVDRGALGSLNPALKQEYLGSDLLIKLEEMHPNMLLIVLPADKGWMSHDMASSHEPKYIVKDAKKAIYNILTGHVKEDEHDFHLSTNASDMLFQGSSDYKSLMIMTLIEQSFHRMGIDDNLGVISNAQFQAVYFDVMKFQLTNHIIERLQPEFVSYPCKNNIDRGGVTSAYCNLMKSIEVGKPMTESEFKQAVHASPVLVKGRALNNHIVNLWNAVKHFIIGMEKNGVELPTELMYLRSWVNAHDYFGKDEDYEYNPKDVTDLQRAYMLARLENYHSRLINAYEKTKNRLFEPGDYEKKYRAMKAMKFSAIKKLASLLGEGKVQFTKAEMEFLRDPEALEQSQGKNGLDDIQAIYRDVMKLQLIGMAAHLPDDADIEMDEISKKGKPDSPDGGPRGGPQNSNL